MDLGISGLASGFDWQTLVDKLADAERTPQKRLRNDQYLIAQRQQSYGTINTQLSTLQDKVEIIKDPTFFDSRLAASSNSDVGTATVSEGANLGAYSFNITQLATSSKLTGQINVGNKLNATSDVSGLLLQNAGFASPVTAGIFSINGKQITISPSESLQSVFDKINSATGGVVTGSYNPDTDKIELLGMSEIVLGSATDTSNFLQAAKLSNNGTNTVSSTNELGALRASAALTSANFGTAVASGAGAFKINGVSIAYNADTDSLASVLDRINQSSAGVTASYDSVNDGLVFTNKNTGDTGMVLEDVTGNFLQASGMLNSTLSRGKNLIYSINDGGQRTSQSNTITESSSDIKGLSVSILTEGVTTVSVTSDKDKIKQAIKDFITEFNKTQTLIDTETASSTDATGKVTAGKLASELDAYQIATDLRNTVNAEFGDATRLLKRLADIGISSSGYDNSLVLDDEELLDNALDNSPTQLLELFTDDTNGVAARLNKFLEKTVGDDGTLVDRIDKLTVESSNIDKQVTDLEKIVQVNRQALIDSFISMETAQAQSNEQLKFLQKMGV